MDEDAVALARIEEINTQRGRGSSGGGANVSVIIFVASAY